MVETGNNAIHILVADQDRQSTHDLGQILAAEGYAWESASSGASALVMARNHMPSLMIVDTTLDGCTGFDFARAVHDEYPLHDIPVIFVSQTANADLVQQSRAAGGTYFLRKPFDPSVLLELIDKSLWMPHLVRRHIDNQGHQSVPRPAHVPREATVRGTF